MARTNGTDPVLLDLLALIYAGTGNLEGAIQTERKAIAMLASAEGRDVQRLKPELTANLAEFERRARNVRY